MTAPMERPSVTGTWEIDPPPAASAVVSQRWPFGEPREMTYLLHDQVVAIRQLDEEGQAGAALDASRRCAARAPVELGRGRAAPVGSAVRRRTRARPRSQWDTAGREIGSYQMNHGTGVDLWRAVGRDGSVYLSEVRYLVAGQRHGFEWILTDDQRSVVRERRFAAGLEHGISREWTTDGQLEPGSPTFYLLGCVVERDDFEVARTVDSALPEYRPDDDQPTRRFPAMAANHLEPRERS